jgi:hypothetical protein
MQQQRSKNSPCAYREAFPVLYWVTFMVMCFLQPLQKAFFVLGTFTWAAAEQEQTRRTRTAGSHQWRGVLLLLQRIPVACCCLVQLMLSEWGRWEEQTQPRMLQVLHSLCCLLAAMGSHSTAAGSPS